MEVVLHRTLVVGAGGFLGASARYLVGGLAYRFLTPQFPYAPVLGEMVKEGLATVEKATVIFYRAGDPPKE